MSTEGVPPYLFQELARSGYLWRLHADAFRSAAEKLVAGTPVEDYGRCCKVEVS
jgi:hypothetical protein